VKAAADEAALTHDGSRRAWFQGIRSSELGLQGNPEVTVDKAGSVVTRMRRVVSRRCVAVATSMAG